MRCDPGGTRFDGNANDVSAKLHRFRRLDQALSEDSREVACDIVYISCVDGELEATLSVVARERQRAREASAD
jgi:hypothetical protein